MIEFQDVSFTYPGSTDGSLHHISLTIPTGQCVLLCGRSGCGKTTLTRLINGLIPQFFAGELSGKILLDGENPAELPIYRIAEKVGSVFQNPRTQFFNVDTDSEIAFGLENEAVPRNQMEERVRETAKVLHIEKLLSRNIFALSGGQKQRLAAATSMVCEKELLIFDEPTSGLDYDSMVRLAGLIRRLSGLGKIIFIVTHDYEFVCRTSTRVLHLAEGRIKEDWIVSEESIPKIKEIFDVR